MAEHDLFSDSEKGSSAEESEFDLNIRTDPRVEWLKERILTFIGMDDEELFYNMFAVEANRAALIAYLTSPWKPNELLLDKRTFYVTKIIVDKLIHEDKEFTEWSKYLLISKVVYVI